MSEPPVRWSRSRPPDSVVSKAVKRLKITRGLKLKRRTLRRVAQPKVEASPGVAEARKRI